MDFLDKLYEIEYNKINTIEELLIYLYNFLTSKKLTGIKEIDNSILNDIDKEKLIRRFILNSYNNSYKLTKDNYLEIANQNFGFDYGNNWLYDKSIDVNSYSFCKVYFSIQKEKYYKTIKELVNCIEILRSYNNGIGQCKFRTFPSNDSVILRFNKKDAFITFSKLIERNKEIINSIGKPNLFIPNINGVGMTTDAGGAYVFIVELLVTDYLNKCILEKTEPNTRDFTKFILNTDFMKVLLIAKMCNYDEDIAMDYKDILLGKVNGENDKKLIKSMFI